jgi:hypothetical protein
MAKKSSAKGSSKAAPKSATNRRGGAPALDPVTFGIGLAGVIAGPSLWTLYQAGNMDLTTALLRGGLVATGCGLGIAGVNRLIADYRVQIDRERRIQEMLDALENVVHEGLPIQPPGPPRDHPPS